MKMKLTQAEVDALVFTPAGPGKKPVKENVVFDTEQRGLAVRIFASGERTFYVKLPTGRIKLGSCSTIKLKEARKMAVKHLGDAAHGKDPVRDRQRARLDAKKTVEADKQTLRALFKTFEEMNSNRLRPRTLSGMARAIHDVFKDYLDVPAAKIDRKTAILVLDARVRKGSPVMAHRTAAYMSTVYAWAVKREALALNPFLKLPYEGASERDRVLEDWELRAIWKAAESMGVYGAIVRLLALTGQRRGEVAALPWAELSPDFSTWSLPKERAKNGNANIIPLPPLARTIIAAQAKARGPNPHVFPGVRNNCAFADFTVAKSRLDAASGVSGWTLHDLRRTLATNLQKLGVRFEVNEALLNHVTGKRRGVAGIYQRHSWGPEKRSAMEAWEKRLRAIVDGVDLDETSNVTSIARA